MKVIIRKKEKVGTFDFLILSIFLAKSLKLVLVFNLGFLGYVTAYIYNKYVYAQNFML